jgi:cystathionine gamma-synthase/O-acetylhomoserine (thiol)-lyase
MTGGEHTRATHPPAAPVPEQVPLGLPVYRTAAWAFETAQEYADLLNGDRAGYSYSRNDNPTCVAFAEAVAAMEGANVPTPVTAQPFASGMAAIAAVFMTFTRAGGHVVAPREIYGGTFGLLTSVLDRFGVTATFADSTDPAGLRAAIRPETTLLWGETLANPTMTVADLPGLAAVAREAGIPFAVDSTFASPAVCRPLEHGVDVVVHSATKYIGGHSDVTGGVAVGSPELMDRVRHVRIDLGGVLSPDDAFLLHRGLATLPLRMDRHCRTALAVATALAEHPKVVRVDHPGLPGHRDHDLVVKLFDEGRYGAVVTVTPEGDRAVGLALCDALQLVRRATSLGGTHSKVSHVASTTHRQLGDAALAAAGIGPAAVRISVGLEDAEDLVADLVQALDQL